MSKIGELFDSALEGYARGSNPRYAKQQDARQLAKDMYGIQQAIGKTGMAGHPMESALLMMQSANPVLQQRALDSMQEYQNRKSEGIKAFEYEGMLSDSDKARFAQLRGSGWETVGQPVKTRDPKTGAAVYGVLMANNSTGEQKMQYLNAPVHESAQVVERGGVRGWEFPPNGSGRGGAPMASGGSGVPRVAGDQARAAVNAPDDQTNTYGTDPVAPGTVPAVDAADGTPPLLAAPTEQTPAEVAAAKTSGPYDFDNPNTRTHIQQMTAIEQAKANQELWNARQQSSPKRFFGSVDTTAKLNQFSNKVYKTLQQLDEWGDAAASKTPEEVAASPGSPAQNLHSNLSSIQSDIVLNAMEALKAASESGSTGFGQMAIPEFRALRDSIEGLNGADTAEQIRGNLLDIMVKVERLDWASKVKSKMEDELAKNGRTTLPDSMKSLEDAARYYGVEPPVSDADHFRNSVTAERASSLEMLAEQKGYAQWARKYGLDVMGALPEKLGNPMGWKEDIDKRIAERKATGVDSNSIDNLLDKIEGAKGPAQERRKAIAAQGYTGMDVLKTFPGVQGAMGIPDELLELIKNGTPGQIAEYLKGHKHDWHAAE